MADTTSIVKDNSCNGAARGIDPRLRSLADNGGPTLTHALLQGSPAIDTGDPNTCGASDQRGVDRVDVCHVGAYEFIDEINLFVIPLSNGSAIVIPL